MCASVRGLRESRPGEDWKLLPLLTAVVAKSARSAPVALPRKPGCRMYIRWSTCSYNVAKVCIYIRFLTSYMYISFIMLLLFAMLYIYYCTFSVFIVYWILDFTSFWCVVNFLVFYNIQYTTVIWCILCIMMSGDCAFLSREGTVNERPAKYCSQPCQPSM